MPSIQNKLDTFTSYICQMDKKEKYEKLGWYVPDSKDHKYAWKIQYGGAQQQYTLNNARSDCRNIAIRDLQINDRSDPSFIEITADLITINDNYNNFEIYSLLSKQNFYDQVNNFWILNSSKFNGECSENTPCAIDGTASPWTYNGQTATGYICEAYIGDC